MTAYEYTTRDGRRSGANLGPIRAAGKDTDTGKNVGLELGDEGWVEIPLTMTLEESEYIHRRAISQYPNHSGYAAIFEQGYRTALTEERFGGRRDV